MKSESDTDHQKALKFYLDMLGRNISISHVKDALQLRKPDGESASDQLSKRANGSLMKPVLALMQEAKEHQLNITTRVLMLDENPIVIIDNLLPEQEVTDLCRSIATRPYELKEFDFPGDEYPIFSSEFELDDFLGNYTVARKAIEMLRIHFSRESHKLTRAYVNMCQYGDMEYPHRDCVAYSSNVTALYYANDQWDYRWGGETKFYDSTGDTRYAVLPRPGRLVLFRGAVEHSGSVPTRICKHPRYTLALKFSSRSSTRS